jgi:hypothetical protein
VDSGFPLEKTDNLGHRMFRWNRKQHVDMIRHEVALFDTAVLLLSQRPKHIPQMLAQLLVERFATVLRDEDRMVLALPL